MAELAGGDERFRDDRGEADPAVAAALAAFAAGTGGERAVLTALAGSRLLVPVIAVLADEPGPAGEPLLAGQGEKSSEMAMPSIVGSDGRRALPAFTSAETVRRWQPGARPVPLPAVSVWQAAVQESCAVIIDIAGPVTLVVEGARLAALAAGMEAPALHQDPDAWQQVAAAAAGLAPGIRVKLSAPEDGLDFMLELAPPQGATGAVPAELARRIADAATVRLGGRVRAGIAVVVRPPS
jgi:hypothetical protein